MSSQLLVKSTPNSHFYIVSSLLEQIAIVSTEGGEGGRIVLLFLSINKYKTLCCTSQTQLFEDLIVHQNVTRDKLCPKI